MNSVFVVLISMLWFLLAYIFYGNLIQNKVWRLDLFKKTPAVEQHDGRDFVAAKHWTILFGHHFSSIAGAGPIIGPVIACALYGWLPAFLWVIFGAVFLGGMHDFSALVLSLRHSGTTVGNVTEHVISRRSRLVFSIFLWLALILVVAVFAAVTAQTLISEPKIVVPTFSLVAIAILFGLMVYRFSTPQWLATIICVFLMGLSIWIGMYLPIQLSSSAALKIWILVLLLYAFVASIVPVHILLQPRDYLSVFILLFGLVLGYLGIFLTQPTIKTPAFVQFKSNEGTLWPVMFVLIACGAISGFHSLIASGTTSKQLPQKRHAKVVALGGMLLEGALAVMAIIAVCAGLSWYGNNTQTNLYPALIKSSGWIVTFGKGYGELVKPMVGVTGGTLIAIFILNGFVMTTLDSATRICRYITEELFGDALGISFLRNRYAATLFVVILALILALGYWKAIWPVFGASNQLIAALVLLVATVYLFQKGQPTIYTFIPAIFMTVTTAAALVYEIISFWQQRKILLAVIAAILLLLALDMIIEASKALFRIHQNKILKKKDKCA
ncbi:MAG: carbon starvation protein A [Candidatus Omnitrophica bacterium]|nr:carbon starvation protein A [Candidatus Omnitrophota bacterium]